MISRKSLIRRGGENKTKVSSTLDFDLLRFTKVELQRRLVKSPVKMG